MNIWIQNLHIFIYSWIHMIISCMDSFNMNSYIWIHIWIHVSWQWHRSGYCWTCVGCQFKSYQWSHCGVTWEVVPNSSGNKAAANLCLNLWIRSFHITYSYGSWIYIWILGYQGSRCFHSHKLRFLLDSLNWIELNWIELNICTSLPQHCAYTAWVRQQHNYEETIYQN